MVGIILKKLQDEICWR